MAHINSVYAMGGHTDGLVNTECPR